MKKIKIAQQRWSDRLIPVFVVCILTFIGVHIITASHADPLDGVTLGDPSTSGYVTGESQASLTPQINFPNEPSGSLYPNPDFISSCSDYDSSTTCLTTTLGAIDNARRVIDGLHGMSLDINKFATLSEPEQLFVATNLERIAHGLLPATAMTTQLDGYAQTGANDHTDPVWIHWSETAPDPMTGGSADADQTGANWAGNTTNTLAADYYWMYLDGPGINGAASIDIGCTAADNIPPCWGHRQNILTSYTQYSDCSSPQVYMGAAAAANGSYAEMIVGACGTPADEVFTWTQAEKLISGPATNVNTTTTTTTTEPGTGSESGTGSGSSTTAGGSNPTPCFSPCKPPSAAPKITSLGSSSGSYLGQVPVVIYGSNFENSNKTSAVKDVKFSSASAPTIIVKSKGEIIVTTPGDPTCGQTVSVKVITTAGTSNSKKYQYSCTASISGQSNSPTQNTTQPAINQLGSYSGSYVGGVTVVISGNNFENSDGSSAVTSVTFGGAEAQWFTVTANDYMIAATPGDPNCDTVPVQVTTSQGSSNTQDYAYTGCPVPVTPPPGPPAINQLGSWEGSDAYSGSYVGGVTVVISGNNFENSDGSSAVTSVTFGGAEAQWFTVTANDYMIAATPGDPNCDTVPVQVTTSQGSSNTQDYAYTGCPVPVTPPPGPPAINQLGSWEGSDAYSGSYVGGVTVVISGNNFENSDGSSAVTSVTFGGAEAQWFTVTANDYMIAATPGDPNCDTVPVQVTTSQGSSNTQDYAYTGC